MKYDKNTDIVSMKETIQVATHLTQPQDANTSGKIFGGFLMQKAFEIAWVSAFVFFKRRPKFVSCDDISFHSPVPAGSVCVFTATVCYVQQPSLAEIAVQCEIIDATKETKNDEDAIMEGKLSNTFEFVFTPSSTTNNNSTTPLPKKKPLPEIECENYEDWIKMIRGKEVVKEAIKFGQSETTARINQLLV